MFSHPLLHIANWAALGMSIVYIPAMRLRKVTLVQGDYLIWAGMTVFFLSELFPRYKDKLFWLAVGLLVWGGFSLRAFWRKQAAQEASAAADLQGARP